jgi:uncharacterized protein (UPF0332 family)
MSGRDFLRLLGHEEKLALADPSEVVMLSYRKKSEGYLASARLLVRHDRFEEAVPLVYYSMYYSVMALLARTGIRCENHAGTIILLREIFGVDESPLEEAKRERIDTQYYVDRTVTRHEVSDLTMTAETFNNRLLDVIERLGAREITRYRNALEALLVARG